MKLKNKLLIVLGAMAAGAMVQKYVQDHKAELDQFVNDYGAMIEETYQEDDLIEPSARS